MANKQQLRIILSKNIKNSKSKKEDKKCRKVVKMVADSIETDFNVHLELHSNIYLKDIITNLKAIDKNVEMGKVKESSNIRPDGGILYLIDKNGYEYIILISEMKSQGTNDLRKKEGKKPQSMGNAVERLGKNVIGFRTLLHNEAIFPFVCFGDGCDFKSSSTIPDRVRTIAKFGELNKNNSTKGVNYYSDRGAFYFRVKNWTEKEMKKILYDVAERSIYYYFSKYGKKSFIY